MPALQNELAVQFFKDLMSSIHSRIWSVIRQLKPNLPAALLLMVFSAGWISGPLAAVVRPPVECGMDCCVESGECCCFMERQMLREMTDQDADSIPLIGGQQKRCQTDCAVQPSGSSQLSIQQTLPKPLAAIEEDGSVRLTHQKVAVRSRFSTCNSSPRAPPLR